MALTRKFLNSLKLEEAVIESIIEAHGETVDALKKQRDDAIAEAGTVSAITQERDQLKQQVETLTRQGGDAARVQAEFDAFKQQVEADKLNVRKTAALHSVMQEAGIARARYRDDLIRGWDLSAVDLDEHDQVTNKEALLDNLRTNYSEYIAVETTTGVPPLSPPPNPSNTYTRDNLKTMTPEQINDNWEAVKKSLGIK